MPNTARFGADMPKNKDNSSAALLNDYQAPAYAATVAITTKPQAANTMVKVAQLTGNASITIGTTNPFVGDKIVMLFSADASPRTVTFSTGFAASAALVVAASKYGSATFIFNGAVWVEAARAVTA